MLLRNGGIRADYLGHAQLLVFVSIFVNAYCASWVADTTSVAHLPATAVRLPGRQSSRESDVSFTRCTYSERHNLSTSSSTA